VKLDGDAADDDDLGFRAREREKEIAIVIRD
jgi:hypothetical protein